MSTQSRPEVARLANETRTEFERLRAAGIAKVASIAMADLPIDGSKKHRNCVRHVEWDCSRLLGRGQLEFQRRNNSIMIPLSSPRRISPVTAFQRWSGRPERFRRRAWGNPRHGRGSMARRTPFLSDADVFGAIDDARRLCDRPELHPQHVSGRV